MMQIIIPMSGFGERFRRAGYTIPKPLIEVEGKPIIAHVIDMFPGESNFLFVCNADHLSDPEYRMSDILRRYCPSARIVGILPHKLGPIHAVLEAEKHVDPLLPTVVNYCDFTCYWDWQHFKKCIAENTFDGIVPAYRGFHPHSLGTTNYAYVKETNGWIQDIQEKRPFTKNRMQEYASSGTYYFKSGNLMLDAFRKTMAQNLNVNGEYYVSLAYKILLQERKAVSVYSLQHFMQWGTPEDVCEYKNWSSIFQRKTQPKNKSIKKDGALIVPLAGLGKRFLEQGYAQTKPLIPVSGKPMVMQAVGDLPACKHYCFVIREDMPGFDAVIKTINATYPEAIVKIVPHVTQGQACTALIGLDALESVGEGILGPLTLGVCDSGVQFHHRGFQKTIDNPAVDIVVWSVRGHPHAARNPTMYGWIDADQSGRIRRISVKKPLAKPSSDPIVIGAFTFKEASNFRRSVDKMIARNGRVNGEFYIDECINDAVELGLNCYLFEVDNLISWGTPDDLKTFEYWQSCFHKWPAHPYSIESDPDIPSEEFDLLASRYTEYSTFFAST